MMTGAAATKKKVGDSPISLDFLASFVHSSPDPDSNPGGDVCSVSPTPAARKGEAFTRFPGCRLDFYPVSPPSAPANGNGKRRREDAVSDGEFFGMTNEGLRQKVAQMSDDELRWEIAGLSKTPHLLEPKARERQRRLFPLLKKEAHRRWIPKDSAKDGDGCNGGGARSSEKSVYTFDIEDEHMEAASRLKLSSIRLTRKNSAWVGVQTRGCSIQTVPRKPITVDKMYSSKTSPTALQGNKQRVHAVDPKEHHNEKSQQNANNHYSNNAKRSSVGDAIIVDDDASSGDDDKRSPTPNSVATNKRPDGSKHDKEKGKNTGDDDIKESLNAIMNVRKEMPEERKIIKMKEMEEWTAAEQRKVVAEERMAAAEERRVALEERKVAMDLKVMEQEQKLMFMDTSHLNAKQKAYIELCRDQVLAKRSMSMMGGFMGGMGGGSSANGAMAGGFGAHDAMGGGLGANGSTEATQRDEATHGDASDANDANVN